MKVHVTTAALVLATAPGFVGHGFAQMTGVSSPEPVVITTSPDENAATTPRPLTAAKPSAATPAGKDEVYGPYVPYKGPAVASSGTSAAVVAAQPTGDVDGLIVTSVPEREGELREGTLLKVRVDQDLSTASTAEGSKFTAEVMEAVEKEGRVIIPIGSMLEGQVTQVHGGRRIAGAAALHLEARDVALPDGSHYVVHAQLIDTGRSEFNVDNEGTLKRRDHTKQTLAVMSLTTGSAAAAGAAIGGGVGAAVGAGVGAGISTVWWLKQDRQATLKRDVRLVFSLTAPMILTPIRNAPVSSLSTNGVTAAQ